ncbi:MAG: SurA N-terminal domain-containing protein [Campylobacter sp.]
MITWMQKHKKYLVVTIWISTIAFVGAGFVGWGAYDMNTNRSNSIAKVGHRSISIQEFQNKYGELYSYYNQLFDGKLSEEKAKQLELEDQAIKILIEENLLLNFADDLGLGVSDSDVVKYVVSDPTFQNNGKFDKIKYSTVLKRARITPNEFENSLKNRILLDKLREAIQLSVNKSDTQMMGASFLMQDKISLKVLQAKPNEVSINENELKTLWESTKNEFKTKVSFELEAQLVKPLDIDANESELMSFYDEKKDNYKDQDDKILPFEKAKNDVKKDYILKQTKLYADKEYLKIKKGEKRAEIFIKTDEDNLTLPIDDLKVQKSGDTLKPFEFEDGYMIVKIQNIIPQRIMTFDEAKTQVMQVYTEQKAKEAIEKEAKNLSESDFDGVNVGFIGRDEIKNIEGLSHTEFSAFVSKLFESAKKKNYILLDNKAVVYEILEQKMLDDKKESEYKDIITQNVSYLKNSELMQDLTNALQKRYKIEYYYKR